MRLRIPYAEAADECADIELLVHHMSSKLYITKYKEGCFACKHRKLR